MMNLSVRDNMLFGRDFSDSEILEALAKVHLSEK